MLEIGAIVEGKVTGLMAFGAFVALPDGTSGMVHISEVSNTYVKDIKDHLKEGQQVKVKVISIGDDGKIGLSIKKTEEQPSRRDAGRRSPRAERSTKPNVWQGQPKQEKVEMSFEDMMAKFKQVSDEKMTDLKRSSDSKHGGYSRRGSGKN